LSIVVRGHEIKIQGRLIRVVGLSADTFEFWDDSIAALTELRQLGVEADLVTFMQRLPDTDPKYDFPMEWDNLAVLPVSTFEHWWTKQLGFKARNKAKQAEKKGVVIREVPFSDELVKGIWEIYNESPIRQGKRFPHFGKNLPTVHRMSATFLDRSAYFGAYIGEQLIGFIKVHVDASRTQAGLVHIVSLIKHRDKSLNNALIVEAVRYCAKQGVPYLTYSRYSDGNKKWDSLMDFKERNGFKQVNLPRYYLPLTQKGRVALRLGLHKRLLDYVPDSILSRIRACRKQWYAKKFGEMAE